MYVGASYKITPKSLMYYIFANLAQLIWRMQSTRLVTSTTLIHNLGRQLILWERIFCKLVHPFEELSGQLVACRCEPSLRTNRLFASLRYTSNLAMPSMHSTRTVQVRVQYKYVFYMYSTSAI